MASMIGQVNGKIDWRIKWHPSMIGQVNGKIDWTSKWHQ
jgi:hypothetical protein